MLRTAASLGTVFISPSLPALHSLVPTLTDLKTQDHDLRRPCPLCKANKYSLPAQRLRTGSHYPAPGWGLLPPPARGGAVESPQRRGRTSRPLPSSPEAGIRREPRSTPGETGRIPSPVRLRQPLRLRTSAHRLPGPDVTGRPRLPPDVRVTPPRVTSQPRASDVLTPSAAL